jgi:hypothetical protein
MKSWPGSRVREIRLPGIDGSRLETGFEKKHRASWLPYLFFIYKFQLIHNLDNTTKK